MSQAALRLIEKDEMDKNKALESAVSQIERAFGKGSIMRLGAGQKAIEIEAIPTGMPFGPRRKRGSLAKVSGKKPAPRVPRWIGRDRRRSDRRRKASPAAGSGRWDGRPSAAPDLVAILPR